jgi:hypothetical protein
MNALLLQRTIVGLTLVITATSHTFAQTVALGKLTGGTGASPGAKHTIVNRYSFSSNYALNGIGMSLTDGIPHQLLSFPNASIDVYKNGVFVTNSGEFFDIGSQAPQTDIWSFNTIPVLNVQSGDVLDLVYNVDGYASMRISDLPSQIEGISLDGFFESRDPFMGDPGYYYDGLQYLNNWGFVNLRVEAVPEPSEWAAMGLLGAGLLGLVVKNRKKNLAN